MMFAGGVGITHQVSHVRDLLARYENKTAAVRKVILVWVIQSPGMPLPTTSLSPSSFYPVTIFFHHLHGSLLTCCETEHLEWIRPWMASILSMEHRREVLRISLFVTRPRTTQAIHSPSDTVQMFPGRPDIETLLDMELQHRIGAMAVSVCGTGSMADDVRRAVRKRQTQANLDLLEESFTW